MIQNRTKTWHVLVLLVSPLGVSLVDPSLVVLRLIFEAELDGFKMPCLQFANVVEVLPEILHHESESSYRPRSGFFDKLFDVTVEFLLCHDVEVVAEIAEGKEAINIFRILFAKIFLSFLPSAGCS